MPSLRRTQLLYEWLAKLEPGQLKDQVVRNELQLLQRTMEVPTKSQRLVSLTEQLLAELLECVRRTADESERDRILYKLQQHLVFGGAASSDTNPTPRKRAAATRDNTRPDMSFSAIMRDGGAALHLGAGIVSGALLGYFGAYLIFAKDIMAGNGAWPTRAVWTAITIAALVVGLDLGLILTRVCRTSIPSQRKRLAMPPAARHGAAGIEPFTDPKLPARKMDTMKSSPGPDPPQATTRDGGSDGELELEVDGDAAGGAASSERGPTRSRSSSSIGGDDGEEGKSRGRGQVRRRRQGRMEEEEEERKTQ